MLLAITMLGAGALAVFVAYPLLAPERGAEGALPVDVTISGDLKRRRLVVYENLQDLEFEFKAGKISPADYQALREHYRGEAASLMLAAQQAEAGNPEEALVEREVAARRARRKKTPGEEYLCPQCGFENPLPVKFCGECGARITPKSSK